jgi:hypothetical protein
MKANRMKQLMAAVVMAGIAGSFSAGLAFAEAEFFPGPGAKAMELDTVPGPAFTTIDGKVTRIEGNVYVIEGPSYNAVAGTNGNEMRVYVGNSTKKITGDKKVGDKIRAEVTRGGFANSIQ